MTYRFIGALLAATALAGAAQAQEAIATASSVSSLTDVVVTATARPETRDRLTGTG